MKFKIDTLIPLFDKKITHPSEITFLGSCFSDDIGFKFENAGFDVISNPHGTIFHPIPLAQNIIDTFSDDCCNSFFESQSSYFSWNCSTLINAQTENDLANKIRNIKLKFSEYIVKSEYLFITFGTSFAYWHTESKQIVANCHKQNPKSFVKELSEIEEMTKIWIDTLKLVFEKNPNIQIVFTVSPVRHSKDGLIENNRSKARLFELISNLEEHFKFTSKVKYFPSYEIVIDELRDYRFFKEDLIHPNEQAVNYIWEKIKHAFFEEQTIKTIQELEKLKKLLNHQVLTANKSQIDLFEKEKERKIKLFIENNPLVKF